MEWVKNNYLQWSLSGALLGLGFLHPSLWLLGLFGGVYFIYLLDQEESFKKACLGAWLAWSIKMICSGWWVWSIYPIEWLPIQLGYVQIPIIALYWLTASAGIGFGGVFVVLVYRITKKRLDGLWGLHSYFIIPASWVMAEVLGSVIFSIMLIGPGGSINPSFSFGYSGYLFAQHDLLIQIARVCGVYGLSFVFALTSVFLFKIYISKNQKKISLALFVCGVFCATSLGSFLPQLSELEEGGYKVLTIDTNFSSKYSEASEWEERNQIALSSAIKVSLQHGPDYVLLPEDSRFFDQRYSAKFNKSLFDFQYGSKDVIVVDSGRVNNEDGAILQAFVYTGSTVEQIHKRYLVPQGEYVPAVYLKVFQLFGFSENLEKLTKSVNYRVGEQTSQAEVSSGVPGVLFCSESISPQLVHSMVKERPETPFIAHVVSHAWFHESNLLWHQLDTMLKVQAVWSQRYIVSAANQADGKIYTPQGRIDSLSVIEEGEDWVVKQVLIPRLAE